MDARLRDLFVDVSAAYDAATHAPETERVEQAYGAFARAIVAQYDVLRAHITIQHVTYDPYQNAEQMFAYVHGWRSLAVYRGSDMPVDHPMRAHSAHYDLELNDLFRAVHDGFAHFPERNDFSAEGEFRAFKAHARLIGESNWDAIRALFTETMGQHAWLRMHGDQYAPQKAVVLADSLIVRAFEVKL